MRSRMAAGSTLPLASPNRCRISATRSARGSAPASAVPRLPRAPSLASISRMRVSKRLARLTWAARAFSRSAMRSVSLASVRGVNACGLPVENPPRRYMAIATPTTSSSTIKPAFFTMSAPTRKDGIPIQGQSGIPAAARAMHEIFRFVSNCCIRAFACNNRRD